MSRLIPILTALLGGLLTAGAIWAISHFEVLDSKLDLALFQDPMPTPTRPPSEIHCLQGDGSETLSIELTAGLWTAYMSFETYRPYVWRKEIPFDRWNVEHGERLNRSVHPSTLDVVVELVSEAGGSILLAERITPEPKEPRVFGAIDLKGASV